jgi:threonine synthase
VIRKGESAVAILTGNVLKDPQAVMDFHLGRGRGRNAPVEIEPTVKAVERFVRR